MAKPAARIADLVQHILLLVLISGPVSPIRTRKIYPRAL